MLPYLEHMLRVYSHTPPRQPSLESSLPIGDDSFKTQENHYDE